MFLGLNRGWIRELFPGTRWPSRDVQWINLLSWSSTVAWLLLSKDALEWCRSSKSPTLSVRLLAGFLLKDGFELWSGYNINSWRPLHVFSSMRLLSRNGLFYAKEAISFLVIIVKEVHHILNLLICCWVRLLPITSEGLTSSPDKSRTFETLIWCNSICL